MNRFLRYWAPALIFQIALDVMLESRGEDPRFFFHRVFFAAALSTITVTKLDLWVAGVGIILTFLVGAATTPGAWSVPPGSTFDAAAALIPLTVLAFALATFGSRRSHRAVGRSGDETETA